MSDERLLDFLVEQSQTVADTPIDDEGLERLRTNLERYAKIKTELSKFPLANGDEPDVVFRVYREEE